MAINCKRSGDVIWEELDGEALLIDTSNASAWVLNASATHFWKYCEKHSVEAIVEALSHATNRTIEQVRNEVRACAEALQAQNWLRPETSTRTRTVAPASSAGEIAFSGSYEAPTIQLKGLTSGARRRPSPRGNSGPG